MYQALENGASEKDLLRLLEQEGYGFTNPIVFAEKFKKVKSLQTKSGVERR